MASFGPATPILRIFDPDKARAFYVDWLGFEVLFEHRFEPGYPLYLGMRRDGTELHLTEHHGDTTPGTQVRIAVTDLDGFWRDLTALDYVFAYPDAPALTPWGEKAMTLTDPFGNRLTFHEAQS